MEAVQQTPNSEKKKKKVLPLVQLVEETRRTPKASHHLLESKIFAQVKSNNVIEAEPPELHFSGFDVGKEYRKTVKIINITTKVIRVLIIPTQTKYFQIEYTQTGRLVPGLALTITVHFRPDEWRYFFDNVRIHCKGEENLLIPVHAYPVIDDLYIPSQIDLSPVPLGKRSTYVLPLSCSSPVDFEFQVYFLNSHEAFRVHPLSGVIPAYGKKDLSVTFRPKQYGIAEITLQLVISQFNSKPFLCTFTGTCSPNLKLTGEEENAKDEVVVHRGAPRPKAKGKQWIEKTPSSDLDLTTHGNLAKMLIHDKTRYKDLSEEEASRAANQTRQMKEAAFESQISENAQKDGFHFLGQVYLGDILLSAEEKIKILQEQEDAVSEYMINKYLGGQESDIDQSCTKMSSHRVVHSADERPDGTPQFSHYQSNQLESRSRLLRIFQQTVRKVILQVRMNKRLELLRELVSSMKKQSEVEENNEQLLNVKPENLLRFTSPVFPSPNQPEEPDITRIGTVPVVQTQENLTSAVPVFNLKVPQHYKQMRYQKVAVTDSRSSFAPIKKLRKGAQNELLPTLMFPEAKSPLKGKQPKQEARPEPDINPVLHFRIPQNMLDAQNAHPLRVFNPAPSVHAFRPTPFYLESDPEFHLCPLTRNAICTGHVQGDGAKSTPKKFLHREEIIKGIFTWKRFPCVALNVIGSVPTQTSSQIPRMCDPFSSLVLPLEAPPPLKELPDDIREEIRFEEADGARASLNPYTVQAEFMAYEKSPTKVL